MFTLIRVILMLFLRPAIRPWFLGIAGLILLVIGGFFGASSHQVNFQQTNRVTITHYLYNMDGSDDTAYLEDSDGTLYVAHQNSFTPTLTSDQLLSNQVTLAYDPTDTTYVNKSSSNTSTVLDGSAYTLEQVTSFDQSGNRQVFATKDYADNPHGLYRNNWPGAIAMIIGGLALLFLVYRLQLVRLNATKRALNQANMPGYNQPGMPNYAPAFGAPPAKPTPVTPYNGNSYNPAPGPGQNPGPYGGNQAAEQNPYQHPYESPKSYQNYMQDSTPPARPSQGNYPANQPYYPQYPQTPQE